MQKSEKEATKQVKTGQFAFSPKSISLASDKTKVVYNGIFQPKIINKADKIADFIGISLSKNSENTVCNVKCMKKATNN